MAGSSGVAMTAAATETEDDEMAVAAAAEEEQVGPAETKEHAQRILFLLTTSPARWLGVGDARDRARAVQGPRADFEDRLCSYESSSPSLLLPLLVGESAANRGI
ncbi:uncharacterized protein LOC133892950 [Phragmites australis]|uniref:uncharacterized protein LOC133892950 n=1 Tax=Phragmites australis TaxID=29695 RepID=UPI002D79EA2A|nr:uncharacterized protein LOC133892950 [Phragmites australis]